MANSKRFTEDEEFEETEASHRKDKKNPRIRCPHCGRRNLDRHSSKAVLCSDCQNNLSSPD